MKKIIVSLVAALALGVFAAPAFAQSGYYRSYGHWDGSQHYYHQRYHDDLEHRDFHRHLYHRDAHRYPMTWRQHDRLHDRLEHDRFHDRLEHRQYHRSYTPYGGGRGFGISGPGFYFRFGR